MKKFLLLLSISLGLFCFSFTSCPEPQVINEPSYEYSIELNIKNESSSSRTVKAQAYVLYDSDSEKTALKLYDCESLTVESKTSSTYNCTIQDSLCAPPHLSHIILIDEKKLAGFDSGNFTLQSDASSSDSSEKISAVKTNLGSVDWTTNDFPTLSYENKSFDASSSSEIKLIYEVIIKDESDISESEKDDFADGIKISVSHSL